MREQRKQLVAQLQEGLERIDNDIKKLEDDSTKDYYKMFKKRNKKEKVRMKDKRLLRGQEIGTWIEKKQEGEQQ
jgi:hypothetical protein